MANPLKLLKLKPTAFQFIQETPINAPPKKVWSSLLSVDKWFKFHSREMPWNKGALEPRLGGRWYFTGKDGMEMLFAMISHIEPQKLLRVCGPMGMTHLPVNSVAIFELQPRNNGKSTLLRIGQRTFGFIDPDRKKGYQGGWKELTANLKKLAEK